MPSVFSRIIEGSLPARFVYQDAECVAFLSIAPLRRGHTLVVPRREIDHWLDLPEPLLHHLMSVAKRIGTAMNQVLPSEKVGMMIAGLEVPHVHIHLVPVDEAQDLNFEKQNAHPDPKELDQIAQTLQSAIASS